jgi:DNA-binding NtrC family response regulator
MSLEVQVKLLRVIETRQFTPVGDTQPQRFEGKLLAATNTNLAEAIAKGKFREDLYFRLCSDVIETPPLSKQLEESPQVLEELVRYMSFRSGGDEPFTQFAIQWIETNLKHHHWPGNYRELEQCIRNLLIRGEYHPTKSINQTWLEQAREGQLTADELLTAYCRHVHTQTGTYEATATRLNLDRRTVRARVP